VGVVTQNFSARSARALFKRTPLLKFLDPPLVHVVLTTAETICYISAIWGLLQETFCCVCTMLLCGCGGSTCAYQLNLFWSLHSFHEYRIDGTLLVCPARYWFDPIPCVLPQTAVICTAGCIIKLYGFSNCKERESLTSSHAMPFLGCT